MSTSNEDTESGPRGFFRKTKLTHLYISVVIDKKIVRQWALIPYETGEQSFVAIAEPEIENPEVRVFQFLTSETIPDSSKPEGYRILPRELKWEEGLLNEKNPVSSID